MNIVIVPIRDDSIRLEKKATGFKLYKNYTPLECIIERLQYSKYIDKIIFIMPDTKENDNICKIISDCSYAKISYYQGFVNDISGRALGALNKYSNNYNLIINITGDCPLIDPYMIDEMIIYYQDRISIDELGFVSNVLTRSWPDGFDIQIYDQKLLSMIHKISLDKKECTQLGWDIVNYSGYLPINFEMYNYPATEEYFYPDWALTLDYKEDIEVLKNIYNHFDRFDFTAREVIDYLKTNLELLELNKKCRRNIPGC